MTALIEMMRNDSHFDPRCELRRATKENRDEDDLSVLNTEGMILRALAEIRSRVVLRWVLQSERWTHKAVGIGMRHKTLWSSTAKTVRAKLDSQSTAWHPEAYMSAINSALRLYVKDEKLSILKTNFWNEGVETK